MTGCHPQILRGEGVPRTAVRVSQHTHRVAWLCLASKSQSTRETDMPDNGEIRRLFEERNSKINEMRAVVDKADDEKRSLTAEEQKEIETRETEIDRLDQEIKSRETVIKRSQNTTDIRRFAEPEDTRDMDDARDEVAEFKSLNEYRRSLSPNLYVDSQEYRTSFYKMMTVSDQRELSGEELRVLSKASAGAGLNLVPTEFQRTLIDLLRFTGAMRNVATVLSTSDGAALQVPTVSAHGTAAWTAENAAFSASDETFGQKTLNAYKNGSLIKVSLELLQDAAFDLEGYIGREFAQRVGVLENTAYVAGDGSGKPTGVATSATAGITAASATAITADELLDLIYSLSPPYRRNAAFLMADSTVKILRKLKASGTGEYIWQDGLARGEEASMLGGAPSMLWGYPVYSDPDMPAATTGLVSVLFGDFSFYWIRDVDGIQIQRLNELYAENGQIGFIVYHRTDGLLVNTAAVKKLTQA